MFVKHSCKKSEGDRLAGGGRKIAVLVSHHLGDFKIKMWFCLQLVLNERIIANNVVRYDRQE